MKDAISLRTETLPARGTNMDSWATSNLPSHDQFSFWREVLCQNYVALDPVRPSSVPSAASFFGRVSAHSLSTINVTTIRSIRQTIVRGRSEIARMPAEVYFLNLQVSGECRMMQFGREAHLHAGEFALVDSTEPYENDYCSDEWEQFSFRIPKYLLNPSLRDPSLVTARKVSGREGAGALAVNWLSSVNRNVLNLNSDEDLVGRQLVEIVAMSLGAQRGNVDVASSPCAKQALYFSVLKYINLNLADPELSPPKVAAHFHVSTRYLHKSLEKSGATFGRLLLTKRLERCACDLSKCGQEAIGQIAMKWGFNDFSHFSRTFRQKFGMSPRDYKAIQSLNNPGREDRSRALEKPLLECIALSH